MELDLSNTSLTRMGLFGTGLKGKDYLGTDLQGRDFLVVKELDFLGKIS